MHQSNKEKKLLQSTNRILNNDFFESLSMESSNHEVEFSRDLLGVNEPDKTNPRAKRR